MINPYKTYRLDPWFFAPSQLTRYCTAIISIPASEGVPVSAAVLPGPGSADVPAAAGRGAPHVSSHVHGRVRQAQHPPSVADPQRLGVTPGTEGVGASLHRRRSNRIARRCNGNARKRQQKLACHWLV